MAHVEVHYEGEVYRVVGRTTAEVKTEIEEVVASGRPGWLTAYDGYGSRAPYDLFLTAGLGIAVVEVPDELDD